MRDIEFISWSEGKGQGTRQGQRNKGLYFIILFLGSVFCALSVTACATPASNLPPPPPKYIDRTEEIKAHSTLNSLWSEGANLFEDRKARRLNDLVTININESFSGSGKAGTGTSRESTMDFALSNFLGMNTDFNLQNAFGLKDMYKGSNIFDPSVKSSSKSAFKGKGDTNREGALVATVTAKVVEVMPNGNLVLEARKELTINSEKQIIVLVGIARPDDITSDNTIASSKIADSRIYYVGDGVIQEKQSPGWMVRTLDYVWPF